MRIYLSFAREQEFLGACLVDADNVENAVRVASDLGINPGGEVLALRVPPDAENTFPLNTLLSREEIEAFDDNRRGANLKEMDEGQRQDVKRNTLGMVHEECNNV